MLLFLVALRAANAIPPKPGHFFNDYAGVISRQTAEALDSRLEAFERETSSQVLVAIFKNVPGEDALEDFTQRTAEAWGVGGKPNDNGAVLFVFTEARKMRIEVGYGLEGALPDVLAKQIIDNEIVPAFRAGDFDQGVTRGVDSILRATRGEYRGSGRTNGVGNGAGSTWLIVALVFLFIAWRIFAALRSSRRGTVYGPRGRRYVHSAGWPFWSGGGGWGGGSGGTFGGGGGGFHGGGGSFGGGGASGSW